MESLVNVSICIAQIVHTDISSTACDCNPNGVTDQVCDILNGACFCLPNVIGGSDCGVCELGFWNLTAGIGCVPCDCCTNGSQSSACDQV